VCCSVEEGSCLDKLPQGIKLVIVSEGNNVAFPTKGQEVKIHYKASLADGKVIDVSDGPLQINIGVGQVIPAWDLAIPLLSVGTRAIITAAPEFAYGEDGVPGAIPPGATLSFEVELLELGALDGGDAPIQVDDQVVVGLGNHKAFLEQQAANEEARKEQARAEARAVRQQIVDAMGIEELRAVLMEREAEMERMQLDMEKAQEREAELEAEKDRLFHSRNTERAERIRVREELGMLKMTIQVQAKEDAAAKKEAEEEAMNEKPAAVVVAQHTWAEPGPLGLTLSMRPRDRTERSGVSVKLVKGEGLPADLAGLKLVEVNATSIADSTYDEALAIIKAAGRPLTIKFAKHI